MIEINNLNVLFLVLNFISQYDIDYFEDEITLEIEGAIMDAFGLETADEAFNDPFIQELLEQLDGKSEEEIEEKIIQYGFYYMKYLCYSIRTSNERKGKYNHEYI